VHHSTHVVLGPLDVDKPQAPMSWMQRLKRDFDIDIQTCPECGGTPRAPPASLPRLNLTRLDAFGMRLIEMTGGGRVCAAGRNILPGDQPIGSSA